MVLERENQEDDVEYTEGESDREEHKERFQVFKLEVCSIFQVAEIYAALLVASYSSLSICIKCNLKVTLSYLFVLSTRFSA